MQKVSTFIVYTNVLYFNACLCQTRPKETCMKHPTTPFDGFRSSYHVSGSTDDNSGRNHRLLPILLKTVHWTLFFTQNAVNSLRLFNYFTNYSSLTIKNNPNTN